MSEVSAPYEYMATILRVVDGDTVDVMLDLGLEVHIKQRLRLWGINAPEKRGSSRSAGIAAMYHLVDLLNMYRIDRQKTQPNDSSGQKILVRTYKDKKGKYGRYLAELIGMSIVDGSRINLNEEMIASGNAVEYMKK